MVKTNSLLVILTLFAFHTTCSKSDINNLPVKVEKQAEKPNTTAEKPATVEKKLEIGTASALKTATFSVPDFTDDMVKRLTAALADKDGVVSAKANMEQGLFMVTFTDASNYQDILSALRTVNQQITMKGMDAAKDNVVPAKHECGGCPMRNECSHAGH